MSAKDVEKGNVIISDTGLDSSAESGQIVESHRGPFGRFIDGFKPIDISYVDTSGMTAQEVLAVRTANSPLKRGLKGRHIQMIAIGGAIGTGLFIGSGGSLRLGGPAAVLIGYGLTGLMLFFTVHALGEQAVRYPVSGSFATYSTRFIDPSWGFAMGWNYALSWLVTFPIELVAASITLQYWRANGSAAASVNPDAWVVVFYLLIVAINLFGVKGYGEAEFVFSIIKVTAVIGFIILGIVLTCGGGPQGGYIGGRYWHDPGAFSNGVKGVVSVFVNAAFAYGGTELVGLAAAETDNPRKALPSATKQVFWRITLFYIIGLALVGLLVPYNDPLLLNASGVNTADSPFVIAISNAGIHGLPSVVNVVILISVLSVGNSAVYGSSRTLAALAAQGYAPKIFGYIDRNGRPLVGVVTALIAGLLCFLAGVSNEATVFSWLSAFSGLSSMFTWGSICLSHVRLRRAMKVQGFDLEELPFRAVAGVWGSLFGFILNALVLILEFWVALYPVGAAKPNASDFFQAYLSVPVVLAMFLGHKLITRSKFLRSRDIDIYTGVREIDREKLRNEIREEREELAARPLAYRVYKFWC